MLIVSALIFCLLLALTVAALINRTGWIELPVGETRIGCIDGLRGYLALCVMVHHFVIWLAVLQGSGWQAPSNHVFQNFGQGAVALFFMVTGALFYRKVVRGFWGTNWGALFTSRIFRLTPLMWFAFVVVNLVVMTEHDLHPMTREYITRALKWLFFLGLPPLNGFDAGRVVAYAPWTLMYEWMCYLALPLLAIALGATQLAGYRLVLLTMLTAASALTNWMWFPSGTVGTFLSLFVPFLLGMIAFEINQVPQVRRALMSPGAACFGFAALGFELSMFPGSFAFVPCILLGCFFFPVVAGNSYFGAFAARPSILLGEASYGIYLLHGIVLYVALSHSGALMASYGPSAFWVALPFLITIVVVASVAAHRWIELPMMVFGKSLAQRRFAYSAAPITKSH